MVQCVWNLRKQTPNKHAAARDDILKVVNLNYNLVDLVTQLQLWLVVVACLLMFSQTAQVCTCSLSKLVSEDFVSPSPDKTLFSDVSAARAQAINNIHTFY
ncbi:hypothetical protein CBL_07959 [Carabus blaptoides fortunei]